MAFSKLSSLLALLLAVQAATAYSIMADFQFPRVRQVMNELANWGVGSLQNNEQGTVILTKVHGNLTCGAHTQALYDADYAPGIYIPSGATYTFPYQVSPSFPAEQAAQQLPAFARLRIWAAIQNSTGTEYIVDVANWDVELVPLCKEARAHRIESLMKFVEDGLVAGRGEVLGERSTLLDKYM